MPSEAETPGTSRDGGNTDGVKLSVNYIAHGQYYRAGEDIPDDEVPARIRKWAVKEDVASATGPGMKGDEESMQDTPAPLMKNPPTLTLLPPNGSLAMTGILQSPSRRRPASAMSAEGWHSNRRHLSGSSRENHSS